MAIIIHRFLIFGFFSIEQYAAPQYLVDAFYNRAMRVVFGFHFGVVLAVYGHPFPGYHAGGHPEPEAKKVTHDRMQIQCPMCLIAVQENGNPGNSNLSQGNEYE